MYIGTVFGAAQKWMNQNKKSGVGPGLLDVRDASYDSKCTLVKSKETPPLWIHFLSSSQKIAEMELLNCSRLSWSHCWMKSPGQHGDPYLSESFLLFHAVWQKEAGHGAGWAIVSPGEGNNSRAEEATSSGAVQEHPSLRTCQVSTPRCNTLSCLNLPWRNI